MTTDTIDRREEPRDALSFSPISLAEHAWLPDWAIRAGIRRLSAQRLRDERAGGMELRSERFARMIATLRSSPVAIETAAANEQHYELPPRFFELCLGARRKYSACWWDATTRDLDEAEINMLERYVERAGLRDGQDILELGCGWGSLTLYLAERFPAARIVAVSNSKPQRHFIEGECARRGLSNVRVLTRDVNDLMLDERFDRVVSIEMFEHLRNYETILQRIAGWLKPGGKLFVHIFCHRELMYPFETEGDANWMGRHFFTGGLMPAAETLLHFADDLAVEERWHFDGTHYEKTANAWLENHDRRRDEIFDVLRGVYGDGATLWNQRWRMFWMACAELFGYRGGEEWMVAHYRFGKPRGG